MWADMGRFEEKGLVEQKGYRLGGTGRIDLHGHFVARAGRFPSHSESPMINTLTLTCLSCCLSLPLTKLCSWRECCQAFAFQSAVRVLCSLPPITCVGRLSWTWMTIVVPWGQAGEVSLWRNKRSYKNMGRRWACLPPISETHTDVLFFV